MSFRKLLEERCFQRKTENWRRTSGSCVLVDESSATRRMTDDGVFSYRVNLRVTRDSTGIESDLFYSGGVSARILLRYWLGAAPTRRPNERLIAAALPNPQAAAICLSPRSVRSS